MRESLNIRTFKHYIWNALNYTISGITYISPKLNTQIRYKMAHGVFPNLRKPTTFCEKLCWLKLYKYMKNPLVIQCADKYKVREYVQEKGCGNLLNEMYRVFNSADEISLENLPEKFVMKWNFGAGKNFICKDKSQYTQEEVIDMFNKWEKDKCWLPYSELQYKYIRRKIVCEKYLEDDLNSNALPDYKVYCFHGVPLVTLVILNRGLDVRAEFYDQNWNAIHNPKYKKPEHDVKKPLCYKQMMESAKILSEPFPFVRVDFYVVNGQLFFGELTFTPAGGIYTSQVEVHGKDMTEYLHIS